MHISLDSALGRQRRLNSVGESVFQIAPDAAAGYSLRSLTGGDPSVVRVRRESDNGERDFNASGVSSGELVNWVNQQITPPLDLRTLTATGRDGPIIEAAAAYSLRNLSDSYAGDVVEVRRNTDGALKDFKASEVTDGTLAAWVNTSFANALPLDTSGAAAAAYSLRNLSSSYTGSVVEVRRSSDGALRSFTAAEVTDGTLLAWVNEEVTVYTQAVDLNVPTGSGSFITLPSYNIPNKTGTRYRVTFELKHNGSGSGSSNSPRLRGTSNWNVSNVTKSSNLTELANRFQVNNSTPEYQTYTVTFTTDAGSSASFLRFQIYDTGRTYTVRNFTTEILGQDGTVSKWYDQSGNDNHATQGTSASQPKIVSGGSLVTGGIDFDGVNDNLQYNYAITNPTSGSIFSVFNNTATSDSGVVFGIRSGTRDLIQLTSQSESESIIQVRDSGNLLINPAASSPSRLNAQLSSAIFNKATPTYDINVNGGQFSGSSSTVLTGSITASKATIGATDLGTSVSGTFTGTIQEIIYYNSDQSDKRRAIEENIGSNYGITLTSSKDGTVSKWYDQSTTSGVPNANHAVQTDAGKQPKIVDGGSLVTGGLDFDGVNDFLTGPYFLDTDDVLYTAIVAKNRNLSLRSRYLSNSFYLATNNNAGFTIAAKTFNQSGKIAGYFNDSNPIASTQTGASSLTANQTQLLSFDLSSGSSKFRLDGSLISTFTTGMNAQSDATAALSIGNNPSDGAALDGTIDEIIVYNSDQSDNRTALEANIGEVYGIAGIPAYDDTVNGFVETWYDQSGNGNNATQLTASNQPRIVIDGELIMNAKGFPSIAQYRGGAGTNANRFFEVNSGLPVSNSTHFAVTQYNRQFNYHLIGTSSTGSSKLGRYSSNQFRVQQGGTSAISGAVFPTGVVKLATVNNAASGGTTTAFVDGVQALSANLADPSSTGLVYKFLFRGDNNNSAALLYSEFIYYSSDQSANRPAIDANIINHYDI